MPSVRFAIANGKTVRMIRTTDTGLVVERTVQAPDVIDRLFWIGPDPAVWLNAGDIRWPNMRDPDAEPTGHEGEMGFITPAGYVKFSSLTWPPTTKPTDEESYGGASQVAWDQLFTTIDDQLFQSHCSWFGGPDGGWCMRWTYYRRFPAPSTFSSDAKQAGGGWRLPAIKPPATVTAAVVDTTTAETDPDADPESYHPPPKKMLRCSVGSRVVDWPEPDEYGNAIYIGEPEWLATEPPMFRVDTSSYAGVGPAAEPTWTVFEGCDPSKRYGRVEGGPRGVVAIFGAQLSVRWLGKEIGSNAVGGSRVAFQAAATPVRQ